MYEFTDEECQRRLGILNELLAEQQALGPDFECECAQRARAVQAGLIERLHAGDEGALDELLSHYRGCIDSWARDIYQDPEGQSYFKADLSARLLLAGGELNERNFCGELHLMATRVVIAHTEHVLANRATAEEASPVIPGEDTLGMGTVLQVALEDRS